MDLKKQTVSGIKWQVSVSILQKIITFGTTIVLARRLGPSVYGLFSFALVIVSSFELFKSMGIDAALVRRKEDFGAAADTAFLIIPVLGLCLYLLLNATAPAIGRMLDNAGIVPVVRVLGIVFVLSCFTKVPNITLERSLRFKGISVAEIVSSVAFSATAIPLVFLGFGVWTLVYGYVAKVFVYTAMVWYFAGWKPSLRFDRKLALEMFQFGKFVFLTSVLWFLKSNLDNLLIGKFLGATMLGLYAVAHSVSMFAAEFFGGRVYRVIYPAYARLQGDNAQMKRAFLKVLKYLCLVAFPMGLGTFLLGGDFLQLAYGDKWLGAIPVLRVLSLLVVFNILTLGTDSVLMAMGKPNVSFWSVLVQVALFFGAIAPAAKFAGLQGVGVVVVFGAGIAMLVQYYWARRLLAIRAREFAQSLYPGTVATAVMAVAIVAFKYGFSFLLVTRYNFIFEFLVGVGIYFLALLLTNRFVLREMREMVLGQGAVRTGP